MKHDYINDDGDRIKRKVVPKGPDGKEVREINIDRLCRTAPRYTANEEVLRIEQELREDGVEIENPAKPLGEHPEFAPLPDSVDELRGMIESEIESDDPDRDRIGRINRKIERLRGGADA